MMEPICAHLCVVLIEALSALSGAQERVASKTGST